MKVSSLLSILLSLAATYHVSATTLYVDNEKGNDSLNGLAKEAGKDGKSGPFATIGKAFKTVNTSDRIEIANTGKPYREILTLQKAGGTKEKPLVIEGNNALITGLDVVPPEKWTLVKDNIYSTEFYPMSNMLKGYKPIQHWIGRPQIWWIDGKAAKNCTGEDELKNTVNGFYWNKPLKQLWVNLPEGKKPADFKIEIPVHGTSMCINTDWVVVQNLRSKYSWNDGFDTHGVKLNGRNIVFKNCVGTDNCGQGFSVHDDTTAYYEDCHAFRDASSGICNVNRCISMYRNCVLADNTFEAGVYTTETVEIILENCIIAGNKPFEQIWQRGKSKMFFINCVIIGTKDANGLVSAQDGAVFFSQCTFLDGANVCKVPASAKADITIINSIMARCPDFLDIPARAEGKIVLANNIYWDGKGNTLNGKKYDASNWEEYLASGAEKSSKWINPNLGGNLASEPPKDNAFGKAGLWQNPELPELIIPLIPEDSVLKLNKDAGGKACQIGARIPEKVWKAYFEWLKHDPEKQF